MMGCDENPITDWGFDTEALVATVREALNDLGCNPDNSVYAALDTLASELKELRLRERANAQAFEDSEAELEREKVWGRNQANLVTDMAEHLDRAVGALRTAQTLVQAKSTREVWIYLEGELLALAEIEESA